MPAHTKSSLLISRGQDPYLGSQRPNEEIRLASSRPHPVVTMTPRALKSAPSPVPGLEVWESCVTSSTFKLLSPPLSVAQKSLQTIPPRLNDLGQLTSYCWAFPLCKLRFRPRCLYSFATQGWEESKRKASRRRRPGQPPGWGLCLPAGDLCRSQEQWLRDGGSRHPGPTHKS